MKEQLRNPGNLITYRNRDWIVLPSDDSDLLMVKPLGGSEDEITGIYLPLNIPGEEITDATFEPPTGQDLGDFYSAKTLYDSTRLSFRNACGPFRCIGKLSFRPRPYQIVPLVLALKQDTVRLLIADDVGIGKTVEALLILKEMMERGEVKRFAVICPPHLCEQWQAELKDKLSIDAEIIRSSTLARLERRLPPDVRVFQHYPYQVISVDYVKSEKRRDMFLLDCPELIIVDEVHTCARPAGATTISQQQRYHLLHDIASKEEQNLILLTATPHSGKDVEFQSLLGLLKKEFERYQLSGGDQSARRRIARHFILRKRDKIKQWIGQTDFPERDTKEIAYELGEDYYNFYEKALNFARGITQSGEGTKRRRARYWAALVLLRGIMSSPKTGYEMLHRKKLRRIEEVIPDEGLPNEMNPAIESLEYDSDVENLEYLRVAQLSDAELNLLSDLQAEIKGLYGVEKDHKIKRTIRLIKSWLKEGFHPIIFCKFIATAEYVGEILKAGLPKSVEVGVVTSTLADEQRKEAVSALGKYDKRVLVATDCLSEGINLQEHFTAVLHYDLPWNPNRLEQREGRVDRFNQSAPEVKAYLLWGEDNPIDKIVLEVLIKKVREIQRSTGVSISIGEEDGTIVDTILNNLLLNDELVTRKGKQMTLDFSASEELSDLNSAVTNELELAKEKALAVRSIFQHETIDIELIEQSLKEIDEAIGDPVTVKSIVATGVKHLGGDFIEDGEGYRIKINNLPNHLKAQLLGRTSVPVSFESPTPKGYVYLGRNHPFVEQLSQFLINLAFDKDSNYHSVARSSVIQTEAVQRKTTLVQLRVRNVIKEVRRNREIIAEEMYFWGYEGSGSDKRFLSFEECKKLIETASSASFLSVERQQDTIKREMDQFAEMRKDFDELAEERALNLVEAHGRFKELVGGRRYEAVYPVLPPDVLGIYVLLPKPRKL